MSIKRVCTALWDCLCEVCCRKRGHEGIDPRPELRVPDRVRATAIRDELKASLLGAPADGSSNVSMAATSVVWVDRESEAIVHLDSLEARFAGDVLVVALDLETDQTGRATVVVPMALGGAPGRGIAAVVPDRIRGPELLVGRWGPVVVEALMAGLVSLAVEHAEERHDLPRGLFVREGALGLAVADQTTRGGD